MESPIDEERVHLRSAEDEDNLELKHADSVNSIPPPPHVSGVVVPVASEESCDITESEKLKPDQLEEDGEEIQEQQAQSWHQLGTEESKGHRDNCCDKFLKCLGVIPCPSLLSWILLLLGIGSLTGSLLVATWRTRLLLKDDSLLWFMEYTIIGVVVGMFVVSCLLLTASHLSSEPTSRRIFNSFNKNRCAQGLNIFALVVTYLLAICWLLLTAILSTPLVLIVNIFIVNPDTLDPKNYGFSGDPYTGAELDLFKDDAKELLICYAVAFLAAVAIVNSLICFIICISANITHLRDSRFSTLNSYEPEEVGNSKHSVGDTNM